MLKWGLPIVIFLLLATAGLIRFYNHHLWYEPFSNAKAKVDETFVFVGDSMTEYLGNFEDLQTSLHYYYPNKHFLLLNYGYSSTNIMSLPDRIEKDSTHSGRLFQAIND